MGTLHSQALIAASLVASGVGCGSSVIIDSGKDDPEQPVAPQQPAVATMCDARSEIVTLRSSLPLRAFEISADSAGFVIVVDFEADLEAGAQKIVAPGSNTAIASFTEDGTLRFARHFRGQARAVAAGDDGAVVMGVHDSDEDIGDGPNPRAAFVAKYDHAGNMRWSLRPLGELDAMVVAVDERDGSVYVGGSFTEPVNFGATPLIAPGGVDASAFLTKLSADGAEIWAQSFGVLGETAFVSLAIATDGVAVGGWVDGTINMKGLEVTAQGGVAVQGMFDPNGEHLWSNIGGEVPLNDVSAFGPRGVFAASTTDNVEAVVTFIDDGKPSWEQRFAAQTTARAVTTTRTGLAIGGNYAGDVVIGGLQLPRRDDLRELVVFMDQNGRAAVRVARLARSGRHGRRLHHVALRR